MATIKIQRKYQRFSARDFRIFLKGEKIGTIGRGEAKEIEIAPGQGYTLRLKNIWDWGGSPELKFNLRENETKTLQCASSNYMMWVPSVVVMILLFSKFQQWISGKEFYLALIALILLLLIYPFTLGRTRYINLVEIKQDEAL